MKAGLLKMRVAIVHYHLKRGGVTRVVQSALRGLAGLATPPQCVVLSGEAPAEDALARHTAVVGGLHYSNTRERDPSAAELLAAMRKAATDALGGPPDVWHIHNHSLGKNGAVPGVVAQLAREGEALLLQLHDFAEDGRPDNYRLIEAATGTGHLYPSGPRVHYAVLNGRDRSFFVDTGVAPGQLHLLPNPVTAAAPEPNGSRNRALLDRLGAEQLVLYPVRAVRRKNFGEMLLWSAVAGEGTLFANTLGPTNRNYVPAYERWKAFAATHRLPVRLGLAEDEDLAFGELVSAASCLLSTSLAEGFGLGFLEPWLFGKPVAGRDLPEITADFRELGIDLGGFYDGLFVPETWIQTGDLRRLLHDQVTASYETYRRPAPAGAAGTALEALRDGNGGIDFGGLDESMQEAVIERLVHDPEAAASIRPAGILPQPDPERIAANSERVRRHFSVERYAEQLAGLYEQLCRAPAAEPEWLPAGRLLDAFLDPARFRLLRT